MKKILFLVGCFILCRPLGWATNRTVKAGGGGDCTTIQACVNLMAAGDTTTVFAGTYNENVTVSSGSVGLYKTLNVNGADIVSVVGSFVLGSHVKLIGNCPEKQGTVTTGTCGFFISNPSSPGSAACVSVSTSTDTYIVHNVMYACAAGLGSGSNTGGPSISSAFGASFIFIQGNTISYPGATVGSPVFTGMGILTRGDHFVVENNDLSHYTLGVKFESGFDVFRNNSFHDQFETEGSANAHTDIFFSEPGVAVNIQHVVMEGNYERNAVGPNAKGPLMQNETCGGLCDNVIFRFNTVSRTGSGAITNDKSWPNVKAYNNTMADEGQESGFNSPGGGGDNMTSTGVGVAALNNLWFVGTATFNNWNPVMCNSCSSFGHSLYWCVSSCTNVFNHVYQGAPFLTDPGNQHADPLFASYVSPGSTSNDFHLQNGSPAIAAGTFLTTVANTDSGTGVSLVVNDATWFQDGFGLSNAFSTVNPDCVAVNTASNHVCITAVDYTTNTLTLASSISRAAGQGVYLYSKSDGQIVLTGSAPDLGANPFIQNPSTSPAVLMLLLTESFPINFERELLSWPAQSIFAN